MPSLGRPARSRWLLVLVPAGVVATLELLSDTLLDGALPVPWDTIAVSVAVLAISVSLAGLAFGRIDALTGALRARNAELEARGASARALHRVSLAVASESDIEEVLRAVVRHARELLRADVAVLLLEGPDGRVALRSSSGDLASPDAGGRVPIPASGDVAPSDTDAEPSDADAILAFVDPASAVVRLAAPLTRGQARIGLLAIGASEPRGFDADEVETLATLANQATIALEHARLETRLRELAVVEERERIARELHDGIAQVLGYVNTKSQAVDGYLAAGRVEEARAQVAELGSAARAVYVDVREAILGLRSPIEPGQGLGAAIEAHARRVAAASRFAVDVAVGPGTRDLRLDPDAESHLYRIVQEALTNVRKHAGASRVGIDLRADDGWLRIAIADDGRGLGAVPGAGDVPQYGLRSMRERAAAIGGSLEIGDRPGGGVEVVVGVPLALHRREIDATPASAGV